MSEQTLEVHVAFGQRRRDDPLHWMLLIKPRDSNRCTWYHVTGGPTQGTGYTLLIQANKRVDSIGISAIEFIGNINERDINKVKSSAQRVPLRRCQRWTCDLIEDLEHKGLIQPGTAARYQTRIEPSPYEATTSGSS